MDVCVCVSVLVYVREREREREEENDSTKQNERGPNLGGRGYLFIANFVKREGIQGKEGACEQESVCV